MSVVIQDRDNGFRQLLVNVRKFGRFTVRVGVSDAPHEGSPGMSIADVGTIHEYGLGVPRRSFLRGWVDENERGIVAWLRSAVLRAILGGADAADAFGRHAVAGIRARIRRHIPPALEDATVKRKGGNDTPLVDTEQLIDGIEYEVRRG